MGLKRRRAVPILFVVHHPADYAWGHWIEWQFRDVGVEVELIPSLEGFQRSGPLNSVPAIFLDSQAGRAALSSEQSAGKLVPPIYNSSTRRSLVAKISPMPGVSTWGGAVATIRQDVDLVGLTEREARIAILDAAKRVLQLDIRSRREIVRTYLNRPPYPGVAAVFISYRRADNRGSLVEKIRDALRVGMPEVNIFMDVVDISAGGDFAKDLHWALERTTVFLAVIGKEWYRFRSHGEEDGSGPSLDYVEFEVSQALRNRRPVLPTLLEDTAPPTLNTLPRGLRKLAELNAVRVRNDALDEDLDRLIQAITALPRYVDPIPHEDLA